ncbi:MAG: hypothetical protein RMK51_08780 [Meiothermus sp.]|nr:hypothetical protein [Meiothermus sp.]
MIPSRDHPPHIPVLYKSAGVCPEVELRSNRKNVTTIVYWYAKEKDKFHANFDRVLLSAEVFARVPAPSAAPEPTWYLMSGPAQGPDTRVPVDLTWRCQPGKEPITIQFDHVHRALGPKTGLTITEDASLPSGLRVEVTELPQ